MTGRRNGDGTVALFSEEIKSLGQRMKDAKRQWPWQVPGMTSGDTRVGISLPYVDERQAGVYKPGAVVLCVLDTSGVAYVLRKWHFFIVKDTIKTTPLGAEIVQGLRGAVAECMLCGIVHYAVQASNAESSRSYVTQLHKDLPGSDRLTWEAIADVTTCCERLTGRTLVEQFIQPKQHISQIADDRLDLAGKPGPLEIATAICCASFEYSPLRPPDMTHELRSLYPLTKGAQVFGGPC